MLKMNNSIVCKEGARLSQNNTAKPEDKKIISVRIKTVKPEPSAALYNEKDVRQIVTEFVTSWIRGDIIIRFPTAAN